MIIELFYYFISFDWFGLNLITFFIISLYILNLILFSENNTKLIGYKNPLGRLIHIVALILIPGGILLLIILDSIIIISKSIVNYILKGENF